MKQSRYHVNSLCVYGHTCYYVNICGGTVCVSVSLCMCVCVCVSVCVLVEARGHIRCLSKLLPFYVLRQSLSLDPPLALSPGLTDQQAVESLTQS